MSSDVFYADSGRSEPIHIVNENSAHLRERFSALGTNMWPIEIKWLSNESPKGTKKGGSLLPQVHRLNVSFR